MMSGAGARMACRKGDFRDGITFDDCRVLRMCPQGGLHAPQTAFHVRRKREPPSTRNNECKTGLRKEVKTAPGFALG